MELAKAEIPRHLWDNFNTPDLEQSEFLRPGETLETWKPNPFLKPHAEGGRIGLQGGQLVTPSVDGSRPGYKSVGQPRKFDLEAVEKAINSANSKFKYTSLDNLAKQIDGVSDASHLKGIIKRQNLPGLDSYVIKAEKAFIELFKDSSRNADEVIKPLHKIAEMIGISEGKERVRIENISNALKKSKVLNYAEDVKPLINKLSSANFIEKIKGKDWNITDVEHSIYNKTMLRAPKTDAEHLMTYVIRHQDQAGGDAIFNIFDGKSGKRITDMSQVDSYHDIIFKDSKGKVYDMDYMTRKGRTDPMFKEYFDLQDKLVDMKNRKYWPDGSKIIDHTGKHVTFGNYSGSMYKHGYGYKKPYERFPYETDHLNLKKHPFKNLTILPQRINVAIGAADRLKKPDIKYKIGGEHFRNLSIDDLMTQEKALGEKILIFDEKGNHIGKKLKTPYTAAKEKLLDIKPPKFKVPPKGTTELLSFPANLKNLKNLRGKGTLIGAALELAFYKFDVMNEMSKGKNEAEAKAQALSNSTLGLYKNKEYMKDLKKVAEENGWDTRAFDKAFIVNDTIQKVSNEKEKYQQKIKSIEEMEGDPEKKAKALASMKKASAAFDKSSQKMFDKQIEDVAGQVSISKAAETFPTPNLDQIADARYKISDLDFEMPFVGLRQAAYDKLLKEKKETFDVQSKQVDPEAGPIGDVLQNYVFNLPAWHPKHFLLQEEAPHLKEKRHIEDMLKFSPQELYRYNLQRGVDPDYPVTAQSWENLKAQYPGLGLASGGRASYMGGGIAAIRKPHAIPPERQGLRSIMINVNDD